MKKSYSELLKDPRWQKKRLQVFERDNFTCRDCGDSKSTLHAHHCFYEKGPPWETDSDLILTVCAGCHKHRQNLEDRARRALGVITSNLERPALEHFSKSLLSHSGIVSSGRGTQWAEVINPWEYVSKTEAANA